MGYRLAGTRGGSGLPTIAATDEGGALVVSGGAAVWGAPLPPNAHRLVRLGEWDGTWQTTGAEWVFGLSGAGAGHTASPAEAGHPGIDSMATGTTATGRANADSTNPNVILFAAGAKYTCETLVRVPILSTAVEQFVIRCGFRDAAGGDAVDGAYFEVDSQVAANWQCKTSDNSVRTQTDSGVALVANTWVWIKVVVTGVTDAKFYIKRVGTDADYVLVATITTNIPQAAARSTGWGVQILKSVGLTSRTLDADWQHVDAEFTSIR